MDYCYESNQIMRIIAGYFIFLFVGMWLGYKLKKEVQE